MGAVRRRARRRFQYPRSAGDPAGMGGSGAVRPAEPRPRDLRARLRPGAAPRGGPGAREGARARARGRRFCCIGRTARADRCPRLDRPGHGERLHARSEVTRDLVYGRRPVREALRGPREVLELWVTERALKAEPWLRDADVRHHVRPERELTEAAGTRDHQGVVAWAEPYRYADAYELAV